MRSIQVVVTLVLTVAAAACGGGSSATPAAPTASSLPAMADTVVAQEIGSIGDAVEVAAGAPTQANSAACDIERQTFELASDAYLALTGAPASTQQDLVDQGLLREPSLLLDVAADGTIIPAAGSPCT
jgi:hypothetical protein